MGKRVIRVVAAVIEREGCYLITQRKKTAVLPLLWEFPGGRVEEGESDSAALHREIRHRLGVTVEIAGQLAEHVHEYEAYNVHLSLFSARLAAGIEPTAVSVAQVRWVPSGQLENYEFPPADQASMSKLLGMAN